jgi:hypothetical protein
MPREHVASAGIDGKIEKQSETSLHNFHGNHYSKNDHSEFAGLEERIKTMVVSEILHVRTDLEQIKVMLSNLLTHVDASEMFTPATPRTPATEHVEISGENAKELMNRPISKSRQISTAAAALLEAIGSPQSSDRFKSLDGAFQMGEMDSAGASKPSEPPTDLRDPQSVRLHLTNSAAGLTESPADRSPDCPELTAKANTELSRGGSSDTQSPVTRTVSDSASVHRPADALSRAPSSDGPSQGSSAARPNGRFQRKPSWYEEDGAAAAADDGLAEEGGLAEAVDGLDGAGGQNGPEEKGRVRRPVRGVMAIYDVRRLFSTAYMAQGKEDDQLILFRRPDLDRSPPPPPPFACSLRPALTPARRERLRTGCRCCDAGVAACCCGPAAADAAAGTLGRIDRRSLNHAAVASCCCGLLSQPTVAACCCGPAAAGTLLPPRGTDRNDRRSLTTRPGNHADKVVAADQCSAIATAARATMGPTLPPSALPLLPPSAHARPGRHWIVPRRPSTVGPARAAPTPPPLTPTSVAARHSTVPHRALTPLLRAAPAARCRRSAA